MLIWCRMITGACLNTFSPSFEGKGVIAIAYVLIVVNYVEDGWRKWGEKILLEYVVDDELPEVITGW
jgi:hypothetical protein